MKRVGIEAMRKMNRVLRDDLRALADHNIVLQRIVVERDAEIERLKKKYKYLLERFGDFREMLQKADEINRKIAGEKRKREEMNDEEPPAKRAAR